MAVDWAAVATVIERTDVIESSEGRPGLALEPQGRPGAFIVTLSPVGSEEPVALAQLSAAVATTGPSPYLLVAIRPVDSGRRLLGALDAVLASMVEWAGPLGWGLDVVMTDRRLDPLARQRGLREVDSGVWRLNPPGQAATRLAPADPKTVAAALSDATQLDVRAGDVGRVGSVFRRLSLGQVTTILDVADATGSFRVFVPDWSDLSTGRLAPALVEFSRIRGRFPWAGLQLVSFDQSGRQGRKRVSGFAIAGEPSTVHVSPALIRVQPYDQSPASPSYPPTPRLSGASQPVPWLVQVLTHEAWHRVEFGFEAIDYRASIEFRRALGAQLALETLEQAWSRSDGASEAALSAIRGAVGNYATTSRHECTAELFTAWWFGGGHPLVASFGELVERFVPRAFGRES